MNVGVVVDNEFNYDIRVTREVNILKEMGYNVYVLCFAFNNKKYNTIDNVNITRIKINKKLKDFYFLLLNTFPIYEILWKRGIYKFIIKNDIDLIHVHDLYMSRSVHKAVLELKKEIPIILDLHENYPEVVKTYNWTKGKIRKFISKPEKWTEKESNYLNYASKIIVLSDDFKYHLLNKHSFLKKNDLTVFPNVIDFNQFETYKKNDSTIIPDICSPILFYFGGIAERRGIFDTLLALKEIINSGIEITLLLIGPVDKADKNTFENMINDKIIKKYIKYIPWIDISDLPKYMKKIDICLAPFIKNPHHESGIANKIFQYMYGKKPIIASNCKPQADLINKYICGLIYTNQNEYVNSIIKLVSDKNLRDQMGKRAYEALINDFNPDKINLPFKKLYHNFAKDTD